MRYSVITPSLIRPSLRATCESINRQTNHDWEHIVMVDIPLLLYPKKRELIESLDHPHRRFIRCGQAHKDYGNTCRYKAQEYAQGDYLLYLDDDDTYADDRVFETLECVTAPWATFPTRRWGAFYSVDPPGWNKTGSGMFMHRRGLGRWPCMAHHDEHKEFIEKVRPHHPNMQYRDRLYAADGLYAEWLKDRYPYQRVNDRALTIYDQKSAGKD